MIPWGSAVDASVTGALIGLGGATIGALATSAVPLFAMRARRRDDRRRGQRELIGELLACLVAFVHAQAARDARAATALRTEAVVANSQQSHEAPLSVGWDFADLRPMT